MIQIPMMKLAALLLLGTSAFAADLELRYAALERIIAQQLFTQEGRHYVRGSRATKCQFAYLEAPHIDSDNGRLRVKARFSGRTALDVFGGCVGLGDSFDLTLTAMPIARDGTIRLSQVNVSTPKDSYYIRRVRSALIQAASKDFKIEVRDQARKIMNQTGPSFEQEMASFDLGDVRVTPDALVLSVEFRVVIK
jgi:hypothetical protein